MIEFCTKKRMLIAIFVLLSVSLIILMVQSAWSTHHSMKEYVSSLKGRKRQNESCPSGKEKSLEACNACSKLELRREVSYCQEWGYKEVVECEDKSRITRNCDINPDRHESKFWIFEFVCLLVGAVSYAVVRKRQKSLDTCLMEKINKQIAEGV